MAVLAKGSLGEGTYVGVIVHHEDTDTNKRLSVRLRRRRSIGKVLNGVRRDGDFKSLVSEADVYIVTSLRRIRSCTLLHVFDEVVVVCRIVVCEDEVPHPRRTRQV